MTLNGVMALILRYFTEYGSFRGTLRKSYLKTYLNFQRQKCNPKHLDFSDISLPLIWCTERIRSIGGIKRKSGREI